MPKLICNRKNTLFKLGCSVVGISYIVIAAGILAQGVTAYMHQFGLPESTLESPHYADAIFFHFFDMLVIGVLITMASLVESLTFQRVFSSTMLVIQCVYLYLDLQTSDTPFGNSLYKGPNSVAPVVIGFVFTLIFLLLTMSSLQRSTAHERPPLA
jgi:hypothetical protein